MAIFSNLVLRKIRRKLRVLLNRGIFERLIAAKHHRQQFEKQSEALGLLSKDSSSARKLSRPGRRRQRGRDKEIKKSAQEEQLWKIRSEAMREKIRHRKKDAMERWSITATTSGSFRGV
jgi:hypothetical protein